eukprot:s863_g53.t1
MEVVKRVLDEAHFRDLPQSQLWEDDWLRVLDSIGGTQWCGFVKFGACGTWSDPHAAHEGEARLAMAPAWARDEYWRSEVSGVVRWMKLIVPPTETIQISASSTMPPALHPYAASASSIPVNDDATSASLSSQWNVESGLSSQWNWESNTCSDEFVILREESTEEV